MITVTGTEPVTMSSVVVRAAYFIKVRAAYFIKLAKLACTL